MDRYTMKKMHDQRFFEYAGIITSGKLVKKKDGKTCKSTNDSEVFIDE